MRKCSTLLPGLLAVLLLVGLGSVGVWPASADEAPATPATPSSAVSPTTDGTAPTGTPTPTSSQVETDAATTVPTPAATGSSSTRVATAATRPSSAAVVRAPRASIGDLNCTDLTATVTLDNTRSTTAVKFEVQFNTFEDVSFIGSFTVPAGDSTTEQIPVPDHTSLNLMVADDKLFNDSEGEQGVLADSDIRVACKPDVRGAFASVGQLDCTSFTVPVTLDNTRASEPTTFLVLAEDGEGEEPPPGQSIQVDSGAKRLLNVPVRDHTSVFVYVADTQAEDPRQSGELGAPLAEAFVDVSCTPEQHSPGVTMGPVNCPSLTVPLTLDNTRSDDNTEFGLVAVDQSRGGMPQKILQDVPPGAKLITHLPVFNRTRVGVQVFDLSGVGPDGDGALLDEVIDVACNKSSPRGGSTPAVRVLSVSTELPRTGGLNIATLVAGLVLVFAGVVLLYCGRRLRHATSH